MKMVSTTAVKEKAMVSVSQSESVVKASIKPTNYVLDVSPADIANHTRESSDLVVELKNGHAVRIKDFFLNGDEYNYLLISGNGYFLADMGDVLYKSPDSIDDPQVVYIPLDDHDPALLIFLWRAWALLVWRASLWRSVTAAVVASLPLRRQRTPAKKLLLKRARMEEVWL